MTEITVFGYAGATTSSSCCDPHTGCCGPSPVDIARSVQQIVQEKYPSAYRVKFVDTFSVEAFDYSEALQAIQDQNLSLPVLSVAGAVKLSGDFTLDQVQAVLAEVRQ